MGFAKRKSWGRGRLREGRIRSVWIGEDLYVSSEEYPLYACLHSRQVDLGPSEKAIVDELKKSPRTQSELTGLIKLDKEEMRESLRKLETANIVFRSDLRGQTVVYSLGEFKSMPRKDCLMEAVSRHLTYHAPITLDDPA